MQLDFFYFSRSTLTSENYFLIRKNMPRIDLGYQVLY